MSIPDCFLDEQDEPEWCSIHKGYRPCPHCRDEAADREYDKSVS